MNINFRNVQKSKIILLHILANAMVCTTKALLRKNIIYIQFFKK